MIGCFSHAAHVRLTVQRAEILTYPYPYPSVFLSFYTCRFPVVTLTILGSMQLMVEPLARLKVQDVPSMLMMRAERRFSAGSA